jgi:magnesium transporter
MIVNCIAYRAGKSLGDISIDAISDVLKEPNTLVWLGVHEPDTQLLRKVQEEFSLHDLAIEDAQHAHQRPKLEAYADSLFIVVETAQIQNDEVRFGETHLFVGHNFIITIRHGSSVSYAAVRQKCEAFPHRMALGPGFALYSIIDFVVDNYQPVAESLQARFEELELDIFEKSFDRAAIADLYRLKGELIKLRNAVLPIIKMTDTVREMLTTAIQVNLALVTVGQNEVVKQLAGWGAILAIPTVVFSMYGMNFRFMPELHAQWGYPVVVGITLTACALLFRRLRRADWL